RRRRDRGAAGRDRGRADARRRLACRSRAQGRDRGQASGIGTHPRLALRRDGRRRFRARRGVRCPGVDAMIKLDSKPAPSLDAALAACRAAFVAVAAFSAGVNIMMLTAPLYMMQVFDRVLSSRSLETLIYLTLITLLALAVLSSLEVVRARLVTRIG